MGGLEPSDDAASLRGSGFDFDCDRAEEDSVFS
jgi:hypothetical protein